MKLNTRRIAGKTRFETTELISEELDKQNDQGYTTVAVLVNGFEFADAMSIAPFAAQKGFPIFLTHANKVSNEEYINTYNELYIIGGENAVSSSVENQLESHG